MTITSENETRTDWPQYLEEGEKALFGAVLTEMTRSGVPFMVAGAFGVHHYTGLWRNTKDMDLVVLPRDREIAIAALTRAGLTDYFEVESYDREWIYRGYGGDGIVDVIWQMANKVDQVDESWWVRATEGEFAGHRVRFVAPEELIWMKLFVFQAKRCDWPDIMNIIRGTQGGIDWEHLLDRVGEHWRLLHALVIIYDWLCPKDRAFIPDQFRLELLEREREGLEAGPDGTCRNVLLDSRPWLATAGGGDTEENHPQPPVCR